MLVHLFVELYNPFIVDQVGISDFFFFNKKDLEIDSWQVMKNLWFLSSNLLISNLQI